MIERLPTHEEWVRTGGSTSGMEHDDESRLRAVARAIASTQPWLVPLDANSGDHAEAESVQERLKRSVHDRVIDALDADVSDRVSVDIDATVRGKNLVDLTASASISSGSVVRQVFEGSTQVVRGKAQISPVGDIKLIAMDGREIRSLSRPDVGPSAPDEPNNRGFLVRAYVLAVLIPVIGILMALYTAVADRRSAVRRHAIGIAGVAIVTGVAWYLGVSAIHNASQDRNVSSDLRSLLDSHLVQYDSVNDCAHQGGNQYVCTVTQNGQPITVQVTDDGKTIYEQGISANQ